MLYKTNKEVSKQTSSRNFLKHKSYLWNAATTSFRWVFLSTLAIMSLTLTNRTHAQQNEDFLLKKNQFRVGIGATYITVLDFKYSPIVFKSPRKNVMLGYSNRFKKGFFSTNLNVFQGNLSPSSGPGLDFFAKETDINGVETVESLSLELGQIGFNLEICYVHELTALATTSRALYLGGSIEEGLTFTSGFYNPGLINYGSLNGRARFDYLLRNGKSLIFGLSVPLVSVVTRMPYHNTLSNPGKSEFASFFTDHNYVETLNHFQNLRFSVKYHWLIRKKAAFDIAYEASWLHYYRTEHFTQAGSQLSLGFTF